MLTEQTNPAKMSPVALAFLGDAVYSLLVRQTLINQNVPARLLHQKSVELVNAAAQARAVEKLLPLLSEEELNIYKRGRNTKTERPKTATSAEYHMSTGFEALLGYLYLIGKNDRLREIFNIILGNTNPE